MTAQTQDRFTVFPVDYISTHGGKIEVRTEFRIMDERYSRPINLVWKGDTGARQASEYAHRLNLRSATNRILEPLC